MRRRALLVLAIVAVLWGAPSTASAAGGNTLSAAEATPTTGTTLTAFMLRVSYSGSPAIRVSASVAGRTIPMVLTGGSSSQGSWSVTTTLPNGSWPTTFGAVASQGRDPSISGPTITVSAFSAATLPPATVVPTGPATPDAEDEGGSDGPAPSPTDAPAAPAVTEGPSAGDAASAAPLATSPPAETETAPGAPVSTDGAAGGAGPSQATGGVGSSQAQPSAQPGAAGGAAASPQDVAPGATRSGSASRVSSDSEDPVPGSTPDDPGLGTLPIAASIGGLAAAALLGWFGVLAGRRRRATAAAARGPAQPPTRRTAAEEVDAALLRRTLRRAKVRLDEDDPILTSVGIGVPSIDDPALRRARRPQRPPPS